MKNSFLIIILFLSGCFPFTVFDKEVAENYYLLAIDDIEDLTLTYNPNVDSSVYETIVRSTVFALGSDKDFIILKQHPKKGYANSPNKKITNYYIIPLKNKISEIPIKNKIGPLTKIEFEQKRKELGVSEGLDFTIVIEELE